MACAVFSRAARVRPHNTAVAPMLASLRAMAAPMPRPAPVMLATCVSKGRSDITIGLQQVNSLHEQRKRAIRRRWYPHLNNKVEHDGEVACLRREGGILIRGPRKKGAAA